MALSNEQKFLRELQKLSKKHNLYIGGCGCFGSPYLYDKTGKVIVEDLTHLKEYDLGGEPCYLGIHKETKKDLR